MTLAAAGLPHRAGELTGDGQDRFARCLLRVIPILIIGVYDKGIDTGLSKLIVIKGIGIDAKKGAVL